MEVKRLIVKTIPIVRMECPTCIPVLEREVERLVGVDEVRGNYMTKTLKVTYDPNRVQLRDIEAAIERVGYHIAYKKYPGVISKLKSLLRREKPSRIRSISDIDFPGRVLHAANPVAVFFSAPSCPTCRVLKKVYEAAAESLRGKADLYEMDIASTETWRRYDVLTVPTVLIFREGDVAEMFTPIPKLDELEGALSK